MVKDEKQELIGVLLSISLVAKRLADKLVNLEKEEVKNERSISKNY
jgi:hypothetical protein